MVRNIDPPGCESMGSPWGIDGHICTLDVERTRTICAGAVSANRIWGIGMLTLCLGMFQEGTLRRFD